MPKLAVLAMAKDVIIDKNGGDASILSLLTGMDVAGPEGGLIEDEAAVPFSWAVVAYWQRSNEAEGMKTFEQRWQMVSPKGKIWHESSTPFALDRPSATVLLKGMTFPVGEEGEYLIIVSIREYGSEGPWEKRGECSFFVTHRTPADVIASFERRAIGN